MIVSSDLRSCKPTVLISVLSIDIEPLVASRRRNKAMVMEDLPAPVLPTIPTL